MRKPTLEEQIESLRREVAAEQRLSSQVVEAIRAERNALQREIDPLRAALDESKAREDRALAIVAALRSGRDGFDLLSAELNSLRRERDALTEKLHDLEDELRSCEEEREEARHERNEADEKIGTYSRCVGYLANKIYDARRDGNVDAYPPGKPFPKGRDETPAEECDRLEHEIDIILAERDDNKTRRERAEDGEESTRDQVRKLARDVLSYLGPLDLDESIEVHHLRRAAEDLRN